MDTAAPSKSDRIRTINDFTRRTFTGCAVDGNPYRAGTE